MNQNGVETCWDVPKKYSSCVCKIEANRIGLLQITLVNEKLFEIVDSAIKTKKHNFDVAVLYTGQGPVNKNTHNRQ